MADSLWRRLIIIGILGLSISTQAQQQYLTVPGNLEYTHLDPSGVSVLPSGRYLKPAGQTIQITHDPFGMAVSPDGSKTVTLHNGVLNVPYVNQYDATATVLQDFFTEKPDYTPYITEIPCREVFDADAAMKKYPRNIDWRKVKKGAEMDDEDDQRRQLRQERPL